MERGLSNMGIHNLLTFWSEKIRENLTNFFVDQKLLVLIDEIDQKITKIESKKESIQKENKKEREKLRENKIISGKERASIPYRYKPIIKDKDKKPINIFDTKYDSNKTGNIFSRRNEKTNSNISSIRYSRKINNEVKETKPIDINKESIKQYLTKINNLQNNSFNYQEAKIGENILEISKKNKNIISYIDIDLFLQRIAQEKKIYDDMNDNDTLLNGFCIQHPIFISTNTLISKIISCFNYFYSRYLNQDNERESSKNKNQNINVVDKNYQIKNKRDGSRPRYRQIREIKKPSKEIFNSVIFIQDLKTIPYCLIDLLILFIDLHEKYSKETLTIEIINKIESFYNNILNICDVKNKYKDDIEYSNNILKSIKNRSFLKRTKTHRTKIEFEKLFSKKSLLVNKIRDTKKQLAFFNLLDYDSKEIAKEFTRITYHIFSQIQPKEFFKGVFTKKNKNIESPNITEIANRFNQISFWLIEEILSYDYGTERGKIIEKFIDIANELNNLNNFNDCMSIISGLSQMIVTGLAKSWKYVSKNSNSILQKLKNVINFQDNYKNMRDKIEECIQNNSPYIPFLGPYNKRICFLEEYGPYVKDNLVNVDKIVLVQEILDQFYKFKSKKYEIVRNPKNEFIIFQCLDPLNEEELEKLSSFIEPNFVLNNNRSHEKRASNTEINFKNNYLKKEDLI